MNRVLFILFFTIYLNIGQSLACSYQVNNNYKTSRSTWNGGSFTCQNNQCFQEGLKTTYWKSVEDNKLRLPKFRFSEDIQKPVRDLVLQKIETELFNFPTGVLESEIVSNNESFNVGVDSWFNFSVIYPSDSPYFRSLLAYANLQEGNFAYKEEKDMYEILGGNLRLVNFFLERNDMTNDQKANVLVHEFLHYFLNHSQGDTVKYDYLYEGSPKREWVVGRLGEVVPIMYPTPADGKSKIIQEDKAQFREVIGFPQDKDTITLSGKITRKKEVVKAARLTLVNLKNPEYTYNIEIDPLRKALGEYIAYGVKKGTYEIRLEVVNFMHVDLTSWNKITDRPLGMPPASYLKNNKGSRKRFKLEQTNLVFDLDF